MFVSATTGAAFQSIFFGLTVEIPEEDEKDSEEESEPDLAEYRNFRKSLAELAALQERVYGWDPAAPSTPPAIELFDAVKKHIGPAYADQVRFLCALGTPMDHWHGGDGVFTVGECYVCIDLTINPDKKPKHPGIILVTKEDVERETFDERGKSIAERLLYFLDNTRRGIWPPNPESPTTPTT